MDFISTNLAYRQTGYFSNLITDYLDQAASLRPFFAHPNTLQGIEAAIKARNAFKTDRGLLASQLRNQYKQVDAHPAVARNIENLSDNATFTVTTAHQPAIFTGNLYFIYKILHVIKLAQYLETNLPAFRFVPLFYMGSEDADLDELGKIYVDGEPVTWHTRQSGAVGRMNTKGLEEIIERVRGIYGVQTYGKSLVDMLQFCYLGVASLQEATFRLIHLLFARYGLVVLIPDQVDYKRPLIPVFEDDLFAHTPSQRVRGTIDNLPSQYKVQANPRDINLFYLKDDLRGRIEKVDGSFRVHESTVHFSANDLRKELHQFPDRFSPNVILRGLMQEVILPNVAFVGGGGETAYWLELKAMFDNYRVPFPVLILRNSFLILEKKWTEKLSKMKLQLADLFRSEDALLGEITRKESEHHIDLSVEISAASDYYQRLQDISLSIDPSLSQFVAALKTKAIKQIQELEKKLLRAEKRRFEDARRMLHGMHASVFPRGDLQERIDNFLPYYAKWGEDFFASLLSHSLTFEQEFTILEER